MDKSNSIFHTISTFKATFMAAHLQKLMLLASIILAFVLPVNTVEGELNEHSTDEIEENDDGQRAFMERLHMDIDALLSKLELYEWDDFMREKDGSGVMDETFSSAAELIEGIAQSKLDNSPRGVFEKIVALFVPQLKKSAGMLCVVFAIAVFGGLSEMINKGDGMDVPVKLAMLSATALAITAAFSNFASYGKNACELISDFCEICAPALSLLLTLCGCTEANAVLTPKLTLLSAGIASLISWVILPALLVSGILCILDGMSDKLKLSKTVKLIHKTVKWIIGLVAVIYGAFIVLGETAADALDGALFKSAKYAVDKLLPVGGSVVSGTIETLVSSAFVAKNAVGTGAIIIMTIILSSPLISLAAGLIAFRLAAAACEPFSSDACISNMLEGLADTLSCIFASCVCAFSMFALTVGMIIKSGAAVF